jgi:cytoskeletal protein RodZ
MQADPSAARTVDDNGRTEFAIRSGKVGWVFLEIVAVLAIAIGIVWWTLPKKPKAKVPPSTKSPPDDVGE